jgi:hypothetical protein
MKDTAMDEFSRKPMAADVEERLEPNLVCSSSEVSCM